MTTSLASALRCVEDYPLGSVSTSLEQGVLASEASLAALPPSASIAQALASRDAVLIEAPAEVALARIQAEALAPALIYVDPPYASHRDYVFAQRHPGTGEVVERVAFSDRWEDGELGAYVDSLREVLERIHASLDDEGAFLLHVDPRGAPYLAIECDRIFGLGERLSKKNAPGFRNELIWSYGLGGSSPRSWPKKHDNILWYSKGSGWYFDPPMTPARSQRMKGMLKKQPDVIEIATINNMAKDRTGYPTQKPLELLTLLVGAHTRAGELVVDVYGGSGTTALAAYRSGRKALSSDRSPDAVAVARARLLDAGASVAVFRPQLPAAAPLRDAAIFEALGDLVDGVFVASPGGAWRLVRDVHGAEGVVPR